MANLAAYAFQSAVIPQVSEETDATQGVFFTVYPAGQLDWILEKILGWFEGRQGVFLVDNGITDKRGLGYVILEWDDADIDPLFLAILRDEEAVEDYSTYVRNGEAVAQ